MENLIGKKFNMLTILEEVPKPENRKTLGKYFLCKCDCGKEKIIDKRGLISGRVKSCGCLRAKRVSESVTIDITGQKFGRLTVIKKIPYDETPSKSEALWFCQCDCGNTAVVAGTSLRSGWTKSCGCLQKEIASKNAVKNEIGNRYGKLIVIKQLESNEKKDAKWLCKCDCGNYKEVLGRDLRNGHTSSCGCLISKGEQQILTLLQQNNIKYKTPFTCKSLRTKKNGQYKFDFCIVDCNDNPLGFIEYNGKQHYEQSNFFDDLTIIQKRDKEKKEWCKKNHFPLLIIPYNNYNEKVILDFVDLITEIKDNGDITLYNRNDGDD